MMKVTIDVEGVACYVPARWPKYTEQQKVAVCNMVQRLKATHGDALRTVHVDRLVWEGGLRQRWRIDGGYSTEAPQ